LELLPVLQQVLATVGHAPERAARRLALRPLALEGAPATALDGTERRRHRPTDVRVHQEHYSGQKKTPPDTNLLVINEMTTKGIYLGPTIAGRPHDKKAADEAKIAWPHNATLAPDPGFQGSEPDGVLTAQPKKSPQAGRCVWRSAS
jgi:hypothetical protein